MSFSRATAVQREAKGRFSAEIHEGWDIAGNANGGYLLSMAARAMAQEGGAPHPVSVTAHFLSPGRPGPVSIDVEVLRRGRTFSTVRATMTAGTKPVLAALGSFTSPATSPDRRRVGAAFERIEGEPPELPPVEDCVAMRMPPGGFMQRVDVRMHPEDANFVDAPSGRALARGWFRWPEGREGLDALSLVVTADAFPPTIFNARVPVAWTPTLELTTHVRAVPTPGWLRCRFSTRFLTGGFLEEDGEVWDADGRLVAQSRQLALVPRPSADAQGPGRP